MNITELLAHPSTNCPECWGTLMVHDAPGTHNQMGECTQCPVQCENDFHTITPERTERELISIAAFTQRESYPEILQLIALNGIVTATKDLARFCNARGIVPEGGQDWEPDDIVDLINHISEKEYIRDHSDWWSYEAFAGIYHLATAAGIDLWKAIEEQVNDENTSEK